MAKRHTDLSGQITQPGQNMVTGVEAAAAKTAATAAAKAISPARRYLKAVMDRRALRKELAHGPASDAMTSFLQKMNPDIAVEIERFLLSPEMGSLALNLATEIVLGKCGSKANQLSATLKAQLRSLLSLTTSINPTDLDTAAEVLFAVMSAAVSDTVSELLGDDKAFSAAAKASLLKIQDGIIGSTLRNSELLGSISDLASVKSFENEANRQVRNLYGTMRLPHAGATRRVPYDKLYVQPAVRLLTREGVAHTVSEEQVDSQEVMPVRALANDMTRVVLLGDPGGGKSTLSLKLTYDCAKGQGWTATKVPFLIVLREYAAELSKRTISLVDYLDQICRTPLGVVPPPGALEYVLLNGRALVIFDGLDELLDTALRRQIVDAVTGFAYRYPTTPILVTSRRVGYTDAPLDPDLFSAVSLGEFQHVQVEEYVKKWFNLDESEPVTQREELRESFLAISNLEWDLTVNPLMLSLMCGIYASEHYIPRNRPDVYEKCALLLFDSWDKQRGIKPSLSFDAHVQAAMRSLALWLYPQQLSQQGLPRAVLIDHMKQYLLKKRFDNEEEAENAAVEFVDFCKGRAWVLTDVGSELYGFTHRTFLEYFTASQIVRENADPAKLFDYLVERLRSGGWEVVAQLALQILNKTVEDGADDFLEILIAYADAATESSLRIKLLIFGAQSLTYIVPRPDVLKSITAAVMNAFSAPVQPGDDEWTSILACLLCAAPENLRLIAKYTFDYIEDWGSSQAVNDKVLSIAFYPDAYANVSFASRTGYGVSNDNRQFWRAQRDTEFGRVRDAALDLADKKSWVAVALFERGELSIDEVLTRFGPRALFTDLGLGRATLVALALVGRILLTPRISGPRSSKTDKTLAGIIPSTTTGMATTQIDNLREVLMARPLPWFSLSPDVKTMTAAEVLSIAEDRITNPSTDVAASISSWIFFCAALYDYSETSGDAPEWARHSFDLPHKVSDPAKQLLSDMLSARRKLIQRKGSPPTRRPHSNPRSVTAADFRDIGVDNETASFLESWTKDNRISFVSVNTVQGRTKAGRTRLK